MSSEKREEPRQLNVSVKVLNPQIFQATKFVDPRFTNIVIVAMDETGHPVEGCKVNYSCELGVVDTNSYRETDKNGLALATYYSFRVGKDVLKISLEKPGFLPTFAEAPVEVVETATPLKVVNNIGKGGILLNGERIGEGSVEKVVKQPGIYVIGWEQVDGYETPEPVKLYINPNFSVEPITVEGKYVAKEEKREYVELTVHVCITLDDHSGIPNPVPDAQVFLSDGQTGITDKSGFARFKVKANSGLLKIKAKHPQLYECYQEAEINIGNKDRHINLDFGIFFGGEAVVGLEI